MRSAREFDSRQFHMKITKQAYEEQFADLCGLSLAEIKTLGYFAVPCDNCRFPSCPGWSIELIKNANSNPKNKPEA